MTNKELFDATCKAIEHLEKGQISVQLAKVKSTLIKNACSVKRLEIDKAKLEQSGKSVPEWV